MLEAFGQALTRSHFAGAASLIPFCGPKRLVVYHILAVLFLARSLPESRA